MANYRISKKYIFIKDKNIIVKIKQPKIQELDSLFYTILNNLKQASASIYTWPKFKIMININYYLKLFDL